MKRFGYEEKSANSPSTETARAEFLSLVLEIKPDVVSNLFNAAYHHFSRLLAQNEGLIASLCHSQVPEQPKYIRQRAIEGIIPDWQSLQQRDDANSLQDAVENWAQDHNLTADWCLDHALNFLRLLGSEHRELAFRFTNADILLRDLIIRAWHSAAVNRHIHAMWTQYPIVEALLPHDVVLFTFEYGRLRLEVLGPWTKSRPSFKKEVERSFISMGGPSISGARKALENKLAEYLEKVDRVSKELGLEEPPVRWKADDHFRWLTRYQVPPCMKYREIAKEIGKDDKTVSAGIQNVASRLGLTLRSSEQDKHPGRTKGVKETAPRRRENKSRRASAT